MDEIDEAIVELLEVDGRLSHRAIAQGVGLSRSAVAVRGAAPDLVGAGDRSRRGPSGGPRAWCAGPREHGSERPDGGGRVRDLRAR
ncbi:AsnC family protein [Tsukamurella strandjordii]|uniref:AsnC family protein n=1 Tax=Tsukamurella strandjordii TaxID=147577 RepID=UPI0031D06F33